MGRLTLATDALLRDTTVFDSTAGTIQRYSYAPYGKTQAISPDYASFVPLLSSWTSLFACYPLDHLTGLYCVRFRMLHVGLGAWTVRDSDTSANRYAYGGRPLVATDPFGLILVAIDGTGVEDWLTNPKNPWKLPNGRWLTHVANFAQEYRGVKKYWYGVNNLVTGSDVLKILREAHAWVCEQWCTTKDPIDIIGWSRGGFAAKELAVRLQEQGCCCGKQTYKPVKVRFLGLYDPVDMTVVAGTQDNLIPTNVENSTHAFGREPEHSGTNWAKPAGDDSHYKGRDYDHGVGTDWPRMDKGVPVGSPTNYIPLPLNCTHGAIGGCPGYSANQPNKYDYSKDRARSIAADMKIRAEARKVGVPIDVLTEDQYGFPLKQSDLPKIKS